MDDSLEDAVSLAKGETFRAIQGNNTVVRWIS